jgi:hypothetical protein
MYIIRLADGNYLANVMIGSNYLEYDRTRDRAAADRHSRSFPAPVREVRGIALLSSEITRHFRATLTNSTETLMLSGSSDIGSYQADSHMKSFWTCIRGSLRLSQKTVT